MAMAFSPRMGYLLANGPESKLPSLKKFGMSYFTPIPVLQLIRFLFSNLLKLILFSKIILGILSS